MSSHQRVPEDRFYCIEGVLEDRFYCIEGVLSSEWLLKTGLLYRGCPLIGVALEDRFTVYNTTSDMFMDLQNVSCLYSHTTDHGF